MKPSLHWYADLLLTAFCIVLYFGKVFSRSPADIYFRFSAYPNEDVGKAQVSAPGVTLVKIQFVLEILQFLYGHGPSGKCGFESGQLGPDPGSSPRVPQDLADRLSSDPHISILPVRGELPRSDAGHLPATFATFASDFRHRSPGPDPRLFPRLVFPNSAFLTIPTHLSQDNKESHQHKRNQDVCYVFLFSRRNGRGYRKSR